MSDIRAIRQAVRTPAFDEALAAHLGLNVTDLRCLEVVLEVPGITPGQLAVRAGLTTGAVTGVLDRLERAGYVQRRPDPADRRSLTVLPDEVQATRVRESTAPLDAALEEALAGHSAQTRAAIDGFMAAARDAVEHETAQLQATARGGFVGHVFSAPLVDASRGRLVFVSGAPRVALNVAPLGPQATARMIMETTASRLTFGDKAPSGELIRASFKGPLPDVRASGGVVTVRYRRAARSAFSSRAASVSLSGAIPWTIEINGGMTDVRGTLAEVALERVELQGGVNHLDLRLPSPSGTVVVRISGVVSDARLRRPTGVPVALRVAGGVSHLRLDDERHSKVGGRREFVSAGFADHPDRYELEILDGASSVRVGYD
jgi:DNA-binding MarR family transcriptional regulator